MTLYAFDCWRADRRHRNLMAERVRRLRNAAERYRRWCVYRVLE